ncbi:prepilin-type N-terminal cleavage/methylation domain-containing protein [Aequitasia blattaphilus]|uniref:Type II secretion system GspH family protein n=1 Tax=Aequitasia blattaphilus TaxID=2949332 RepID=A0ABT1E7V3_9FIRM|nr:type II secretion system protein [Aequitasia blattaphilus]MCP1101908.1 type II secretion system GspH family protein [Aequitasia blattaphilus]MCR8614548.1 type II secretion system GspH family protein [Aequitasia blattaphilus]
MKKGMYLKQKTNRKGFTQVELIVVMTIMVILLSFAVFGLVHYQRYASFKRNNSYAKELFTAAQSQLSYYKSNGRLEELETELKESEDAGKAGADISRAANAEERLYYVQIPAELTGDELKNSWVYKLTKDYIYDKAIYTSGAVRIEMDPVEGVVYSVCYSDKADSFDESTSKGEDGIIGVSVPNREYEVRKDMLLGYYESDMTNPAPVNRNVPDIQEAVLINEESLYVEFSIENSQKLNPRDYGYLLEVNDNSGKKVMDIRLNDINKVSSKLPNGTGEVTVTCETRFYDAQGNVIKQGQEESVDYKYRAYITTDKKIGLLLDAVDLKASSILLARYHSYNNNDKPENAKPQDFKETFSIIRFGLEENEKINVTVAAFDSLNAKGEAKDTNLENPIMESVSKKDDAKECSMSNARHLFNIRFLEMKKGEGGNTYVQTGDIDWASEAGIIKKKRVYDSNNGADKVVISYEENYKENQPFPHLPILKSNSRFNVKKDGQDKFYFLSAFVMVAQSDRHGMGLFLTNDGAIEDIHIKNFYVHRNTNVQKHYAGAIASTNNGLIKNYYLEDVEVEAHSWVAGVAGINNGTIENGYEKNVHVIADYQVAGLIAGQNDGTIKTQKGTGILENCSVNGNTGIGGAAGVNKGTISNISFKGSTSITGKRTGNSTAGGIAGENLEGAAIRVEGEIDEIKLVDFSITDSAVMGGVAGKNVGSVSGYTIGSNVTIRTAVSAGATACAAGGIVGRNEALGTVVVGDGNTELSNYVIECPHNAGGIIGYNQGSLANGSGIDIHNISVTGIGSNIGGLIGQNDSLVEGYYLYHADVSGTSTYLSGGVGGLVGKNNANGTVRPGANRPNVLQNVYVSGFAAAGGIVGENFGSVWDYTVDSSCSIDGSYPLNSSGYYRVLGGVIGINSGTLESSGEIRAVDQPQINNKGNRMDIVGGIVGENEGKASGYTVTEGTTITGNGNPGVTNSATGGMVGRNRGEFTIGDGNIGANGLTVNGVSNVGGVIGWNEGTFAKGNANTVISSMRVIGTDSNVGGLIGQNATTIEGYQVHTSHVEQTGTRSVANVGGMIGHNTTSGKLKPIKKEIYQLTENYVQGFSMVGGVVGQNDGLLQNYGVGENYIVKGNYTSPSNSYTSPLGGIAGGNTGTLENVDNKKTAIPVRNTSIGAEFVGGYVGGIVGENAGKVSGYEVGEGVAIEGKNQASSKSYSATGGYVGRNHVGASLSIGDEKTETLVMGLEIKGVHNVGGIIGWNEGDLEDGAKNKEKRLVSIFDISVQGSGSNIGGLIGQNASSVLGYRVDQSTITQTGTGSVANVGGVIGYNTETGVLQQIQKEIIQLEGNTVQGFSMVGGVVGQNDGTVSNYGIGKNYVVSGNYSISNHNFTSPLGGIIGGNTGVLSNVSNKKENIKVENASIGENYVGGYVGGIVGENAGEVSGYVVESSTVIEGKNTVSSALYGATGGYIGRNHTEGTLSIGNGKTPVQGLHVLGTYNVGGVIGWNAGEFSNIVTKEGSVTGTNRVGGLIGYNQASGKMEGLINGNDVQAAKKNAGGVIGYNENPAETQLILENSINYGNVTGDVNLTGGLVGQSSGALEVIQCRNYGKGTAQPTLLGTIDHNVKIQDSFQIPTITEVVSDNTTPYYSALTENSGIIVEGSYYFNTGMSADTVETHLVVVGNGSKFDGKAEDILILKGMDVDPEAPSLTGEELYVGIDEAIKSYYQTRSLMEPLTESLKGVTESVLPIEAKDLIPEIKQKEENQGSVEQPAEPAEPETEPVEPNEPNEPMEPEPELQLNVMVTAKAAVLSTEEFTNEGVQLTLTDEEGNPVSREVKIVIGDTLIEDTFTLEGSYSITGIPVEQAGQEIGILIEEEEYRFTLPKVRMDALELVPQEYEDVYPELSGENPIHIWRDGVLWKHNTDTSKYEAYITSLGYPSDLMPDVVEGDYYLEIDDAEGSVTVREWDEETGKWVLVKRNFQDVSPEYVTQEQYEKDEMPIRLEEVEIKNYGYILPLDEERTLDMQSIKVQKITRNGEVYYRILLPDVRWIQIGEENFANEYLYTGNVTVRQKESVNPNFIESERSQWIRQINRYNSDELGLRLRELKPEERSDGAFESEEIYLPFKWKKEQGELPYENQKNNPLP